MNLKDKAGFLETAVVLEKQNSTFSWYLPHLLLAPVRSVLITPRRTSPALSRVSNLASLLISFSRAPNPPSGYFLGTGKTFWEGPVRLLDFDCHVIVMFKPRAMAQRGEWPGDVIALALLV